jgi:hypothetical protein
VSVKDVGKLALPFCQMDIMWSMLPVPRVYAPEGAQRPSVYLVSALPTFQLFNRSFLNQLTLSVGPVSQKSESRDLIMALDGSKEKATLDTVNFEIDMN